MNELGNALNCGLQLVGKSVVHLTPIAWPLVVISIVLLFRKPLAVLISKLKDFKGYGVEILTGDVDETRGLAAEFTNSVGDFMPNGDWRCGGNGKSGVAIQMGAIYAENIYFFSHDLMLCYCALITGADSGVILHTLQCAISHIEKFARDTPHHVALQKIFDNAKKCSESDWTEKRRSQDARKIWLISRNLGDIIQIQSRTLSDRNTATKS